MMLCAYLLFSCIDTSVKWLALLGLPVFQLVFMRYAGHVVISIARLRANRLTWPGRRDLWLVILRGALLALSTLLNFAALQTLPLTLTATIMFSSPLIICLLSGPVLGERVGPWRWGACLTGFAGILVAIRPFGGGLDWAVLYSLSAAATLAGYTLLTRYLSGRASTDLQQLFSGLVGAVALLPFALVTWQSPETARDWVLLCALGFFGWAGHELLTRAHGYAPPSLLSPFSYSFLLYLTAWSWLLFDTLPDRNAVIGAAIIVGSGLVLWLREGRTRANA
ncbi:EamA family transporter [Rhodobacteraceae bacterium KN286]|uniref:EamA family transporter n=2 Tax=Oceanomicrobium pacificus TaxID=2692916 RepID=A0A6B0TPU5_9RHOB|nr:EamA family transporter [Oceanomicrobium pacificus]